VEQLIFILLDFAKLKSVSSFLVLLFVVVIFFVRLFERWKDS